MPVPTVEICERHVTRSAALGLALAPPPVMRTVKLGRVRPRARPMALGLAHYVKRLASAPLPASIDYTSKALASLRQVYGNDQQGDCTMADTFHAVNVWAMNDGAVNAIGTTQEALAEYHRIGGPGDNGLVITDLLDVWQSRGITIGGSLHKIDGYVSVDPANADEVKLALLVFGGVRIGFNVPPQWMGRGTYDGATWDDPGPFISQGGHDVRIVAYDSVGVTVATWGLLIKMTWRALADSRIVDEAYVELSPDWYGSDSLAPNGIDASSLKSDLAKLNSGTLPDWQPSDPPPPEPSPSPVARAVTLTGTLDADGNLSLTGKAVSLS